MPQLMSNETHYVVDTSEQKMDLLQVPVTTRPPPSDEGEGGPTGSKRFSHKWSIVSAMSYFSDVSDDMGGSFSSQGRRSRTCRPLASLLFHTICLASHFLHCMLSCCTYRLLLHRNAIPQVRLKQFRKINDLYPLGKLITK